MEAHNLLLFYTKNLSVRSSTPSPGQHEFELIQLTFVTLIAAREVTEVHVIDKRDYILGASVIYSAPDAHSVSRIDCGTSE